MRRQVGRNPQRRASVGRCVVWAVALSVAQSACRAPDTGAAAGVGAAVGVDGELLDRPESRVEESHFGEVGGHAVSLYRLRNRNGLEAAVTDLGANVVALRVPDRDGRFADVVLGLDDADDYAEHNASHFGSIVGRHANRIAFGRFELDGRPYELATNNGRHHLHGGEVGFNRVLWQARAGDAPEGPYVELRYESADGEEGYPGNLRVTVLFVLTHDDELRIEMSAETDAPTVVNLAHHGYWNLAGHDAGDVRDHRVTLRAAAYTPTDEELIPTGEIALVEGTPFDFLEAQRLGDRLDDLAAWRDREPSGFDENFVVDGEPGDLRSVAVLEDPASGRTMEVLSTAAGVQLYTGNFLAGVAGKEGAVYDRHDGVCLETQHFPDAIHQLGRPGWPSPILRPGETYRHVMVHRFFTR